MVGLIKSKTPKTKSPNSMTPTGSKESKKPQTPSKSEESYFPKKGNWKKWIHYGILIFIILALVVALIIILTLGNVNFGDVKEEVEVCKTPECFTLANNLHNWKDDSVDPCKDFYQYSCGKYSDHNTVDNSHIAAKTEIGHGLIREFLRKNEPTSSKTEKAMHHLFAKCQEMADPAKQSDFFQEWRSDVEQIGWPMLNPNWNDNLFDLTGLLRKTAVINLDNGFTINYGIFSLLIPVARKVFIGANSPHATNFYEIQKVLNTIFPESSRPAHLDMLREVQEVHWFGLELQKIDALTPQRHILDVENNYDALKAAFPGLNFDYLISDLLSNHVLSWNKIKNKIYGARGFLEKAPHINTLVQNYKRAASNYFVYQYVRNSYIYGATLEKSKCEQLVPIFLPLPSLRVFVRNHFDKEAIKDVDNLVENIRSSFIEMLQSSEWAHEKLKNGAIRKAKIMKKLISYPQELETPGALDKHFNIHLDSSVSYYWTMKRIERASINLLMDYVSSDFPMNPVFGFMSNAVYTRADNTINVLAPIMDEPLFHTSFPNYAKIAGIGFIIGHEIGHGFDAEGILFDENGKQQMLFDGNDSMEYAKKITCIINQYNNYDDPSFGRKLNGSTTIMELLADEIGQDAAWRTFKKLDLSQEKKIIGFEDLSFEQLYFRIGALKWCSPRSPLTLEDQLKQVHATTSFRVNGVFANEKGFAEAFNCPAGSPMNPVKKCTMF